jgi:hypothetical protein
MGFAWHIKVWVPVGPPEGQRSDISTPHAHDMGLWAVGRGCFGSGRPTENGGGRCLASNEGTSRLACRLKPGGVLWLGPKPGLARGQAERARLASTPRCQ